MINEINKQQEALLTSLRASRDALKGKGADIADDAGFADLAGAIEGIPTGSSDDSEVLNGLISRELTSITIPDGTTSIGDYVFYDCSSLTSITIPNSVTSIGLRVFSGCRNLNAVYISDISKWCEMQIKDSYTPLYYDGNLYLNGKLVTQLVVPDSVYTISNYAFSGCASLTSVTFGENSQSTSIGRSAFSGCPNLTSVTIPSSVTDIGIAAFNGCSNLTSITIPDSVTGIGSSAFLGCSSLTSITIPDSVTAIGKNTFDGCSSLTSITIPGGVTSIGGGAFDGCSSLTNITIGDGVTSIGASAFYDCTQAQTYDFSQHTSIPTLVNKNAFTNIPDTCQILVPATLYDEWIAATNWSTYADHIVAV